MSAEINKLLPLAAKIAREFANIPGLPHAEIELAAQEALANAFRLFDASKGNFSAYASQAMRNALRDLYEKQVRHHKHHLYILDQPATESATHAVAAIECIADGAAIPVPDDAAMQESAQRLEVAMAGLSPRLRVVAEGIRDGKSYSEIGSSLGISKQAAHKLAHAAFSSLREQLASMGYHGVDTVGLLKSGCGVSPQAVLEESRLQS